MRVSITGTPGTGKTSVSEEFEDFKVVSITDFVEKHGLGEDVDVDKLVEKLESEIGSENIIVEGHLSHHLEADYCVVLRCNPEKLRERLSERDYSERKIDENIESEILDLVLVEALEKQENIIEIDTTGKTPVNVARDIKERIENNDFRYGNIDWTEYI